MNEDDLMLRVLNDRRDEAKKAAELRRAIQKKQLESQRRIIESRRINDEKIQKMRNSKRS